VGLTSSDLPQLSDYLRPDGTLDHVGHARLCAAWNAVWKPLTPEERLPLVPVWRATMDAAQDAMSDDEIRMAAVAHVNSRRAREQRADVTPRRPRAPRAKRPRGRARARGAGRPRAAATRSSTRSGDSPDGGSDEPGPGDGRRCAAPSCNHPVYGARKRFCGTEGCNQARAAERQRQHRASGLSSSEQEQFDDARRAGYVLFGDPGEHAQAFLWKFGIADGDDPGEFNALIEGRRCRCNGHHIDGGIVGCLKCGMARPVPAPHDSGRPHVEAVTT
jgi:hypothetical protein